MLLPVEILFESRILSVPIGVSGTGEVGPDGPNPVQAHCLLSISGG